MSIAIPNVKGHPLTPCIFIPEESEVTAMRYPILLFDADNTLFDFPAAERQAFEEVCREAGLPCTEEGYALYHRCNGELWEDFNHGKCTKDFLLVERFRRYLDRSGQAGDPEQMNRTHLRMLATSAVLFPDTLPVCRTLAETRRLYIITNAVESVQRTRFASSPITPCFQDFFISEAVGCGKPEKAYFDYVLSHISGAVPEDCLVIGDSLSSDIRGANNAGLPCCWFNPDGRPRPDDLRIDYEIRSLTELLSLLEE